MDSPKIIAHIAMFSLPFTQHYPHKIKQKGNATHILYPAIVAYANDAGHNHQNIPNRTI